MPDADWVVGHAEQALRWFADDDLFLFLLFMEPHDPYRDHRTGEILAAPSTGESVGAARLADLKRAYGSEVR